jgi:hypothetical protein
MDAPTKTIAINSSDRNVFPIPIAPSGSYLLRGRFTRTRSGNFKTVGFLLPAGRGRTVLVLDHWDRATSGLDRVEGHGVGVKQEPNPTNCPVQLGDGNSHTFEARVELKGDQATVMVQLDGREIIRWQGSQQMLDIWPGWRASDARTMGLALYDAGVTVEQLDFTSLDGIARVLELPPDRPLPPPGATVVAAAENIDLLPLLDLEHGVFDAKAKRTSQGIELSATENQHGRLAVPVWPHGNYDLFGSFSFPGNGTPVLIIPTARNRGLIHWRWNGNNSSGSFSGFEMISGKSAIDVDNPTRITPSEVQPGRRYSFRVRAVCDDDNADIAVELDGKPYMHWKGPESALSLWQGWDVPHQRVIGIGIERGRVTYHELKLKMLSGEAWILVPRPAE